MEVILRLGTLAAQMLDTLVVVVSGSIEVDTQCQFAVGNPVDRRNYWEDMEQLLVVELAVEEGIHQ